MGFRRYFYHFLWKAFHRLDVIEQQKGIRIFSLLGKEKHFQIVSWYPILSIREKYHRSFSSAKRLSTVTIVFNGDVCNPGLADRLRAMVSVYYWCKKNNITMKIFFDKPFLLSNYLEPNLYDWYVQTLDYSSACPISLISCIGRFGESRNQIYHRKSLDNLLSVGYESVHLYTNTNCYDEFFQRGFVELFKIHNQLGIELNEIKSKIKSKYITISFRFSQLLGDLEDSYGTPLGQDEKIKLINTCAASIKSILELNKVEKCIVTSDSITFIDAVSSLPYVYIIPGSVGHICNDVSESQVRKTFLDMFMISMAEKAYMVRTPIMYRSGFAKRAAMITGIPFEEVLIGG